MAGSGARAVTWVVDDERATAAYRVLLTVPSRASGRTLWCLATLLDWLHGTAVAVALFGLTPVLAVACQYDPTGYLSDDHENAVALAPYWRGGALTVGAGLLAAAVSGLLLVAVCRYARSRLPDLAIRTPPARALPPVLPLITVRESRRRVRRDLWVAAVFATLSGVVVGASLGHAAWAPGLTVLRRLVRLLEAVGLGALLLLGLVATFILLASTQMIIRLAGSFTRDRALAELGVRLVSPPGAAAEPGATSSGVAAAASVGPVAQQALSPSDPALLAFFAVPRLVASSAGRRTVAIPCGAKRVPERPLAGWMVAATVWSLQETGLIRFRPVRRRLTGRRRILLERVAPGSCEGVVAAWLTGLPTDDPDALIGESTVGRTGPLGELRSLVAANPSWVGTDPYGALARAVFVTAAEAGRLHRPDPDTFHYDAADLSTLQEAALALAEGFDEFTVASPDTAGLLLRESRRALRKAASIIDMDEPITTVKDVLAAGMDLIETWRARRSRTWPVAEPGSPG